MILIKATFIMNNDTINNKYILLQDSYLEDNETATKLVACS